MDQDPWCPQWALKTYPCHCSGLHSMNAIQRMISSEGSCHAYVLLFHRRADIYDRC